MDTPVVAFRDASYSVAGYRSFEFVSFDVAAGDTQVLLSVEHAPARDLLLAVAGLVRPTAGSLVVCGRELSASLRGAGARGLLASMVRIVKPRPRLPRGSVGMGVVERIAEVPGALTAEEVTSREIRARRTAKGTTDTLEFLASFDLATMSEQRVDRLDPAARARLSAALALAGAPRVAVLDLTDPFVAGLSSEDAARAIQCVQRVARASGAAAIVVTSEPCCSEVAESALPLDIPAAERLGFDPLTHEASQTAAEVTR